MVANVSQQVKDALQKEAKAVVHRYGIKCKRRGKEYWITQPYHEVRIVLQKKYVFECWHHEKEVVWDVREHDGTVWSGLVDREGKPVAS